MTTREKGSSVLPVGSQEPLIAEMRTLADAADGFGGGVSVQAVRDIADRLQSLTTRSHETEPEKEKKPMRDDGQPDAGQQATAWTQGS